ncbi:MAG: RT0821/Lpp0805 family surface protein [Rhodospirillaceae bacterium]
MTRLKFVIPTVAAVALALAGCEGQGMKQTGGTLVGGAAGGLLGSQFGSGTGQLVGTALGAVAGAWLGNEVGRSLDNADKAEMQRTSQNALETSRSGTTSTWTNPDTGNSGTVTPTQTYQTASGEYCREYQQTVSVGGKTEQAYGTACRQPDGSWKIIK